MLVSGVMALVAVAACSSEGATQMADDAGVPTSTVAPSAEAPSCDAPDTGTQQVTLDGVSRSFEITVPDDIGVPMPLLVIFHGFSSSPTKFEAVSELMASAADQDVLAISPAAGNDPSSWGLAAGYPDDAAFLDQLVDGVEDSGCVDPERTWFVGFSAGSGFAGVYGCGRAGAVQGMVLVSGLAPTLCPDDVTPRVVVVHGTEDPVVPFAGGPQDVDDRAVALDSIPGSTARWAERAGCGPDPQETGSSRIDVSSWTECAHGGPVDLVALRGAGHIWPGDPARQGPTEFDALDATCLTLALVADPEAEVSDLIGPCAPH